VPVPAFDELPLLGLPRVVAPADRQRLYRPHQERRRLERVCQRDGLRVAEHPYCQACGALAGPSHPIALELVDGRCPGCAVARV
jgi:hypothetical protein